LDVVTLGRQTTMTSKGLFVYPPDYIIWIK
jgi:hypothetical protein